MRRLLLVGFCVLVFSSAAMAQNTVDTTWNCPNPPVQSQFAVGDTAGHAYMIIHGKCKSTATSDDFMEKSGHFTEFQEHWTDSYKGHGNFNVTMANGDMVFYTYEQKSSGMTASNKWKIESGTGKYEGISGSGTCSATLKADGSGDWHCTGTYSLPQ